MKRWLVSNDMYQIKLYYKTLEECLKENPDCDIVECDDYRYLDLLNIVIDNSTKYSKDLKNRDVYKLTTAVGSVFFKILEEDGLVLDCIYYQIWSNERFVDPITWSICDVEEFYNKFMNLKPLSFKVHTFRKYGEPRMIKPKELTNIKERFKVDFIPKKCKCNCYVSGNNLWIKHRDFFSEEMKYEDSDFGTPLEYRVSKYLGRYKSSKFIYADSWGGIVLRNEAWIVFENLLDKILLFNNENLLAREMLKVFSKYHKVEETYFCGGDWEHFFEKIATEIYLVLRKRR